MENVLDIFVCVRACVCVCVDDFCGSLSFKYALGPFGQIHAQCNAASKITTTQPSQHKEIKRCQPGEGVDKEV